MNLDTTYLGIKLPHPLMPGASPMGDNLDTVRKLEDAGAAAIVLRSLFEEQMTPDEGARRQPPAIHEDPLGEVSSDPWQDDFSLSPDQYLEQVRKVKAAVSVPIIASLNGTGLGGWVDYASMIQQAGADALELNLYYVATDPEESASEVEARTLDVLRAVRSAVKLPLAVKLSPSFSSPAYFARELAALGADGLVLFNRFYQPDIDPESLETVPKLALSTQSDLRLRLRWLGILCGKIDCSLACSGGVHESIDVIKALMAGADAVQCVSSLLRHGPEHLRTLLDGVRSWMEEHDYESVVQLKGCMSMRRCPDPGAYERGNYLKVLQIWQA